MRQFAGEPIEALLAGAVIWPQELTRVVHLTLSADCTSHIHSGATLFSQQVSFLLRIHLQIPINFFFLSASRKGNGITL